MTAAAPPYRVLLTCGVFEPGFRGGGPVRSVAGILDTLPENVDVTMVTSDRDLGAAEPYPGLSNRWVDRHRVRIFYLDAGDPRACWRVWRALRGTTFDLLYVNSVFSSFSVAPVLAARLGLIRADGLLVAPRGEFAPGALGLKARKKRAFLTGWTRVLRSMNARWHVSSPREAADVVAQCPWASVLVNHDPVALPAEPLAPATPAVPVRLVFISRIARMKNLDLIIEALRTVPQPVVFDIYGPQEDTGYWAQCAALIDRLPGHVRATYRGELRPDAVRGTFARYDAFVLPTRGENFGHAIAESLSASCPVVCSDRTQWTPTLLAGGGSVLADLTAEHLGAELRRIAALPPAERADLRRRAGAAYRAWRATAGGRNILALAQQGGPSVEEVPCEA